MPLLPLMDWAAKDEKEESTVKGLNATQFVDCLMDPHFEDVWLACIVGGDNCKTVVAGMAENKQCGASKMPFIKAWKKIRRGYRLKYSGHIHQVYGVGSLVMWGLQYSMDKSFLNDLLPDLDYKEVIPFIIKYKTELWQAIREGIKKEDYGESVAQVLIDHMDEMNWEPSRAAFDRTFSAVVDRDEEDDDDDIETGDDVSTTNVEEKLKRYKSFNTQRWEKHLEGNIRLLMRDLVHRYHLYGHRCRYRFFKVCDPFYEKINFKV